jgi:uncharacterized protein (TIGR02266 family)
MRDQDPTGEFFVWQRVRAEGASPSQLLAEFSQDRAPVDIESIARGLGVAPKMGQGPELRGILRFTKEQASIWLSPTDPSDERRVTLAFLVGHLLLHPPGEYQAKEGLGGNRLNDEAMKFAENLLLPKSLVEQELRAGTPKQDLQSRFGLPFEIAQGWLENAGLLPPPLERRREERVAARIKIRFTETGPAARALRAYSLNLSVGGLCLKTSKKYNVGEVLSLNMMVEEQEYNMQGTVAWSRGGVIGVRFANLSEEDTKRLQALVASFKE